MLFLVRSRRVVILPVTILLVLVLAFSTTFAAYATSLILISQDLFTNPGAKHRTEVEPVAFAFGSTIVTAFQQGRFVTGGSTDIGFVTSQDGGATWTSGSLPGITAFVGGPYARTTNPGVAFDAFHNVWMISSNALDVSLAGVAVVVSRSTDGVNWNAPVAVAPATPGQSFDKPGIGCDNSPTSQFYGNCYVQWDDNSASQLISISTSTDGGLSWGPAQQTADQATGLGGLPVVQPNGTVIVPYTNAAQSAMGAFQSTDGGSSWSSVTTFASSIQQHAPGGGLRMYALPSVAIDGSGKVYVVWQECNFESGCTANDLVLATSTNGTKWSRPRRIPIDPVGSGVDHFLPGLAADTATSGKSAHLALDFYYYPVANCTSSTCQLDVGYVSSTNGGRTWTANSQIAGPMSLAELAPSNLGPTVGDYIATTIMNGTAYPVVAVGGKPPKNRPFNESIFTVAGGMTVAVGTNVATETGRVSGSPSAKPSTTLPIR